MMSSMARKSQPMVWKFIDTNFKANKCKHYPAQISGSTKTTSKLIINHHEVTPSGLQTETDDWVS